MRESIHQYFTVYEPFQAFSAHHIWAMVISVLLIITVPIFAKHYLKPKQQSVLGIAISLIVMGGYLVWIALEAVAGSFDVKLHLPFHLCRFADVMIPLLMWKRNYRLYEILFFWGLSGGIQAAISPDAGATFPHFFFIRFWICHMGLILALVYATVVYDMRPTWQSLKRSFIALNLFFLVTIPVNLILDANYFWICGKPPVASLLDYMGPWPWYILSAEVLALVHFVIVYSPFAVLDRIKAK